MPASNPSDRKPAPLKIDDSAEVPPISTPALREQYDRKRALALEMTSGQILLMEEKERDEHVYKFLSPDEIWKIKAILCRVPPPIDISKITQDTGIDRSLHFEEYEQNRKLYFQLSDDEVQEMPIIHVHSFFAYLSAGEIIDAYSRLKELRQNGRASNTFNIPERSEKFLQTINLEFALKKEGENFVITKDFGEKQTVPELRLLLATATDKQLGGLSDETLKEIEEFFSISELRYFQEKKETALNDSAV
uniref:EF-hand domain-containing protein n=1 Tax=Steinernema glaseri TaxID=37863 RepID=A0A1I7YVD2_9BILA